MRPSSTLDISALPSRALSPNPLWHGISVATTPRGVAAVWLDGPRPVNPRADFHASDGPLAAEAIRQIREYLVGERRDFELTFDLSAATPFQRGVLEALLDVPFGTTTSYGALADRVGCASPRAVGQAVGWNPLPILVPCHRVVTQDGRLGGYSGGLDRKVALLAIEGVQAAGIVFSSRIVRAAPSLWG